MNIKTYRIRHAYSDGTFIEFNHPEEIAAMPGVTGVYSQSGGGYCSDCAGYIDPTELASYETADCAMILCENCNKDTQDITC